MRLTLGFLAAIGFLELVLSDNSLHESSTGKRQGNARLRSNLLKSLMDNYDSGINPDDPNVKLGLSMLSVDLDEAESTLDASVWLRFTWQDSRLAWDTEVFPVDVIRVDFDNLWVPDMMLLNSAETFSTSTSCVETKAVVYSDGRVIWVPPCQLSSFCKTTLKTRPYEPQTCTMKFGSWTYDSSVVDLDFFRNQTSIDLAEFQELSAWKVLSTSADKNSRIYPCCPEPYTDLTFKVMLQRNPEADSRCSR